MRRVGLIGTGLVGGSIGLALRRAGVEVRGFDHDAGRLEAAVAAGAIDDGTTSITDVVADADVVVVAVPVGQLATTVVAALDADAAVVTDVGSVKAPVVREVQAARPARAAAVGKKGMYERRTDSPDS